MRHPDFYVPDYLHRWYLIPRNKWFNVYLHQFVGDDDDRASHDHPWWSISFCLKGEMVEEIEEHRENETWVSRTHRYIQRFRPYFRKAEHSHIMRLQSKTAWTLFITGPRRRDWGFWTRRYSDGYSAYVSHWVDHVTFLDENGQRPISSF